MELPSVDQTALIGVLGVIGTALTAIARGLFKMLNAYIEAKKLEGIEQGKILAKLSELEKDIEELKNDIKGVAGFVGTPRSKGEANGQKKVGTRD